MQRSNGNLHGAAAAAAAVSITAMEYCIGRTVNGTVGIFSCPGSYIPTLPTLEYWTQIVTFGA